MESIYKDWVKKNTLKQSRGVKKYFKIDIEVWDKYIAKPTIIPISNLGIGSLGYDLFDKERGEFIEDLAIMFVVKIRYYDINIKEINEDDEENDVLHIIFREDRTTIWFCYPLHQQIKEGMNLLVENFKNILQDEADHPLSDGHAILLELITFIKEFNQKQ
jgi:hypothetical protein